MAGSRRPIARTIPDGGRRIRALRQLLGYSRPSALADDLDLEGLGANTLANIESDAHPRQLWEYEAQAIARELDLDPTFFTAPVRRLGDTKRRRQT